MTPGQRAAKPVKFKKPSTSFCKELSNMFVSGGIALEKFNMSGKSTIKTKSIPIPQSVAHPQGQSPLQVAGKPQDATAGLQKLILCLQSRILVQMCLPKGVKFGTFGPEVYDQNVFYIRLWSYEMSY